MLFLKQTADFLSWFSSLGLVFFRLRPATTATVIVSSMISRAAAILSFILPLKVLALVASNGEFGNISAFFSGGQTSLIIALTALAVVSFFLSIFSDIVTDRLAKSSTDTVLNDSNQLAVIGNQQAQTQSVYADFADCAAGLLFSILGFAAVAYSDPKVIAFLAGAMVAEFIFTAMVLNKQNSIKPGVLERFIIEDGKDYLDILAALNFLVAFAAILYPFVTGVGGAVVGALLSFIILRRVLRILAGSLNGCVKLYMRRGVINPLMFRGHQYQREEGNAQRTLREAFYKKARQARVAQVLHETGLNFQSLDVRWRDSPLRGATRFDIALAGSDSDSTRYEQQVYMPKSDYRLENETVLFEHVSRHSLAAPQSIATYSEGAYRCQICTSGLGVTVDGESWPNVQRSLYKKLMQIEPPDRLVDAFTLSRPLLADRLSTDFIARLEVAIDTNDEWLKFKTLREKLPMIRQSIRLLPLWIYNPEIKRFNVFWDVETKPLVMTWGNWSLEPLGAALTPIFTPDEFNLLVERLRKTRSDIDDDFDARHMNLARVCWTLEQQIATNMLKAAFASVDRIMENPLLEEFQTDSSERLVAGY